MKTIFGLVLVLYIVAIVPGQERVIDQAEFDSVVGKANNHRVLWTGEKYRMTVTTSSKAVGRPQTDWSSKLIFEYASPEEFRTVSSSTFGNKTTPSLEWIRIGPWVYSRSGDGSWTKKVPSGPALETKKSEDPPAVVRRNAEYKFLGTANLMGKPVHIYVKSEQLSGVNKENGENIGTDIKVTYWIDGKGAVVKREQASDSRSLNFTSQTVITTVWEKDPSITFAVPEIVS